MIRRITARFSPPRPNASLESAHSGRFRRSLFWMCGKARLHVWNRYFAFCAVLVALAEVLSRMSGLSGIRSHLRIEGPILIGLYWALNLVLRPRRLSPFVAAFPMAVIYTGYDLFYLYWGNVF